MKKKIQTSSKHKGKTVTSKRIPQRFKEMSVKGGLDVWGQRWIKPSSNVSPTRAQVGELHFEGGSLTYVPQKIRDLEMIEDSYPSRAQGLTGGSLLYGTPQLPISVAPVRYADQSELMHQEHRPKVQNDIASNIRLTDVTMDNTYHNPYNNVHFVNYHVSDRIPLAAPTVSNFSGHLYPQAPGNSSTPIEYSWTPTQSYPPSMSVEPVTHSHSCLSAIPNVTPSALGRFSHTSYFRSDNTETTFGQLGDPSSVFGPLVAALFNGTRVNDVVGGQVLNSPHFHYQQRSANMRNLQPPYLEEESIQNSGTSTPSYSQFIHEYMPWDYHNVYFALSDSAATAALDSPLMPSHLIARPAGYYENSDSPTGPYSNV